MITSFTRTALESSINKSKQQTIFVEDEVIEPEDESEDTLDDQSSISKRMTLTFLGTSSSVQSYDRNVSSTCLRLPGSFSSLTSGMSRTPMETWVFDCGDGTAKQYHMSKFKFSELKAIFITHLHGDHFLGLPALAMSAKAYSTPISPLKIFGPHGLVRQLGQLLLSTNYHIEIYELVPQESKDPYTIDSRSLPIYPKYDDSKKGSYYLVHETDEFRVLAVKIMHSVFTVGYVIEEKSAAISGVLPRKVTILGDTCDASAIAPFASGSNVLVHECTFLNADKDKAIQTTHSTAEQVGQFASIAKPQNLVLNHFSPRYFKTDTAGIPNMRRMKEQVISACTSYPVDPIMSFDTMRYHILPTSIESKSDTIQSHNTQQFFGSNSHIYDISPRNIDKHKRNNNFDSDIDMMFRENKKNRQVVRQVVDGLFNSS